MTKTHLFHEGGPLCRTIGAKPSRNPKMTIGNVVTCPLCHAAKRLHHLETLAQRRMAKAGGGAA